MKERNAIILAAGTSSRLVPLNLEKPKGLLEVKGEVLVERQIRQLIEAGICDITIVVGYKAEMFRYLSDKYGVSIVVNEDYAVYNNTSSVIRVLNRLGNTFLCSSDNYFPENVFRTEEPESFYSALYASGPTGEYCLSVDENDRITQVTVGGEDSWYMVGHVFFNKDFSERFAQILGREYSLPETRQGYWEDVYIRHIDELPMKIHRYRKGEIEEFDSLDELRLFDESYVCDTRSSILKEICRARGWSEEQLHDFLRMESTDALFPSFSFSVGEEKYQYNGTKTKLQRI